MIMRVVDIQLSFPSILIALLIAAMVATGLLSWRNIRATRR